MPCRDAYRPSDDAVVIDVPEPAAAACRCEHLWHQSVYVLNRPPMTRGCLRPCQQCGNTPLQSLGPAPASTAAWGVVWGRVSGCSVPGIVSGVAAVVGALPGGPGGRWAPSCAVGSRGAFLIVPGVGLAATRLH